jgi:glutaminase
MDISMQQKNSFNSKGHHSSISHYEAETLFKTLDTASEGFIYKYNIIEACHQAGFGKEDQRLATMYSHLSQFRREDKVSLEQFIKISSACITLLYKIISGNLVIPSFPEFCRDIEDVFLETKDCQEGKVADYIPQLKRVDPKKYAVGVCSIDGQRFSLGDSSDIFCVQSTCKPINYCIALNTLDSQVVHRHVGHEPSGMGFNELTLNENGLPHNPMINSGAIMTSSLIKPELDIADRFDYVLQIWKNLSGGQHVGFNNAVYLSERQTADRNFALGYFMKEHNAFPEKTNLLETLEFYFQCCSIETSVNAMSIIAGTLANGGVCPVTGQQIFSPDVVKNCLSLMYSCGMYDFSGEFAFSIGLPAKSGVSGIVIVVIPQLMGVAIWSPRLDKNGNSVKGIEFCKKLSQRYNIHNYDSMLLLNQKKKNLHVRKYKKKNDTIQDLCWSASRGDLKRIQQMYASGIDLSQSDYDGRTALHIAASEGKDAIVSYLLAKNISETTKDRWGNTPLDDAKREKHKQVIKLIEEHGSKAK